MPRWGRSFFLWALGGLLALHVLDLVSTELVTHLVNGCEMNPLLVNPQTCGLLLGRAIYVKMTLLAVGLLPACFTQRLTRSWTLGALWFLPDLWHMWSVVDHNFTILFVELAKKF